MRSGRRSAKMKLNTRNCCVALVVILILVLIAYLCYNLSSRENYQNNTTAATGTSGGSSASSGNSGTALGFGSGQPIKIPQKLLVYYGYPSSLRETSGVDWTYYENGCFNSAPVKGSCPGAVEHYLKYDQIILGGRLDEPSHPDHGNTMRIISGIRTRKSSIRIFGYIATTQTDESPAGGRGGQQQPFATRLNSWKDMGVHGIFIDEFGGNDVSRNTKANQRAQVAAVRGAGLILAVNAGNPDDVFQEPVGIGENDIYMSESFLATNGDGKNGEGGPIFDSRKAGDEYTQIIKAQKIDAYRRQHGFKVWGYPTSRLNGGNVPSNLMNISYYGAIMFGYDSFGWGELNEGGNGLNPYRPRPNVNVGTTFKSDVMKNGDVYERQTDAGTLVIDMAKRKGMFIPK